MYEEDRQLALSYYERMFDAAEDEQALIQGLMSPTRHCARLRREGEETLGLLEQQERGRISGRQE